MNLSDAPGAADTLVGLVDHREFKRLSSADLAEKVVIDTRGMWLLAAEQTCAKMANNLSQPKPRLQRQFAAAGCGSEG